MRFRTKQRKDNQRVVCLCSVPNFPDRSRSSVERSNPKRGESIVGNHSQEKASTRLTKAKGTSLAREVFTRDFWMTGFAILKYIPRSFRVKQVDGMVFFTQAKHDEFRDRVLQITPPNPRQWGRLAFPRCSTNPIWAAVGRFASTHFLAQPMSYRQ